jgi:hypothetical protein
MATGDSIPSFRRCYTCGRYIPAGEEHKKLFCSRACSHVYVSCSICGRYFRAPNTPARREAPPVCSASCTVRYKLAGRSAIVLSDLTAAAARPA